MAQIESANSGRRDQGWATPRVAQTLLKSSRAKIFLTFKRKNGKIEFRFEAEEESEI